LKKDSFFSGLSTDGDIGDACARGVLVGERGGVVIVLLAIGVGREEANGLGGGIGGAELGPLDTGGVVPYGGGLVERAADGVLFTTRPAGIMLGCNFFGTGLGALGGVGTAWVPEAVGPGGAGFFTGAWCGMLGAEGERFGSPWAFGRGGALLGWWIGVCAGWAEELKPGGVAAAGLRAGVDTWLVDWRPFGCPDARGIPTGAAFFKGGGRGGADCCSNILRLAAREDLSPATTLVNVEHMTRRKNLEVTKVHKKKTLQTWGKFHIITKRMWKQVSGYAMCAGSIMQINMLVCVLAYPSYKRCEDLPWPPNSKSTVTWNGNRLVFARRFRKFGRLFSFLKNFAQTTVFPRLTVLLVFTNWYVLFYFYYFTWNKS
jgi:hypothetical protein